MKDFAKALIKGTVILGSGQIMDLLSQWLEEGSVQYRVYALLNGLFLKDRLDLLPGINVEPLPWSTDALPAGLPKHFGASEQSYLGRTMLSVKAMASPALFNPGKVESEFRVEANLTSNIELPTICQALALGSDTYVNVAFYWNDFQELSAMALLHSRSTYDVDRAGIRPLSIGHSLRTKFSTNAVTLSIDEKNIAKLSEAKTRDVLKAIATSKSDRVQIAISRWCKSKEESKTIEDQFIDLRIALEVLYLKDFTGEYSQEMRFRLALFGAWHLGLGLEDRKAIRKTLRKAYDVASGAVHSGYLEHNESNRELLMETQRLCRQGIEKILNEGPPEDWGNLILGSELTTTQKRTRHRGKTQACFATDSVMWFDINVLAPRLAISVQWRHREYRKQTTKTAESCRSRRSSVRGRHFDALR